MIGAGPAGCLAAILLARAGVETLLVDRARFPRAKLCGGCLAEAGLDILRRHGLDGFGSLVAAASADRLALHSAGASVEIPLPPYRVVDRSAFDHDLVRQAIAAGAAFADGVGASVHPDGGVMLRGGDGVYKDGDTLRPRVVVVADGLKGVALRGHPAFRWRISPRSFVGLGAFAATGGRAAGEPGVVTMRHGAPGYAGTAVLNDGSVIIAAAADPAWIRSTTGTPPLQRMMHQLECGPVEITGPVMGGPALTRRRSAVEADRRVFVIGDAGGYIEPFTGEGMTRAFEDAERVTPCIVAALRGQYEPGRWTSLRGQAVSRRAALCRACAWLLRRRRLTGAMVRAGAGWPILARGVGAVAGRLLRAQNAPMGAV